MEAMIQIVGVPYEQFVNDLADVIIKKQSIVQQVSDVEYDTREAMDLLGYKDHRYFKRYLIRNNIAPNRKAHNKKYYLHSQLFKAQTFK